MVSHTGLSEITKLFITEQEAEKGIRSVELKQSNDLLIIICLSLISILLVMIEFFELKK